MEKKSKKNGKVLILLSGGPDSATLAYFAEQQRKETGGIVNAIYLKTGRSSDKNELEAAKRVMLQIGGKLEIVDITDVVRMLGGKAPCMHVGAPVLSFGSAIVLSIATTYALENRMDTVFIAVHKNDTAHGPEYTREYINRFDAIAKMASNNAITVDAPLLNMSKHEVFSLGAKLNVDYSKTWSCTQGGEIHCGSCGACQSRRSAFILAGLNDPTEYMNTTPITNLQGPFYRDRDYFAVGAL